MNDQIIQESDNVESDENIAFTKEFDQVIDTCPPLFKSIINNFSSVEEKKMVLYSTIAATGSLLPFVKINYDGQINYPLLMALFVYPPASGKGKLSLVRKLLDKINAHFIEEFATKKQEYQVANDLYLQSVRKGHETIPPERPATPMILSPGNITSAKLIQQLSQNGPENVLTIFESEADAFGMSANNSQHGAMLSTLVRLAFHHESVSQSRKTDAELLIADTPKLVMVLSGTENQIHKIFPSNADGLLSRFLVVSGGGSPKWRSVKPKSHAVPLEQHFEVLSRKYFDIWSFFQNKHIEVKFTDKQWKQIDDFGEQKLGLAYNFSGEYAGSIAVRHANMITRIAAIITMVDYYESQKIDIEVYCSESNFEVAFWLIKQSFTASLELYKKLPARSDRANAESKTQLIKTIAHEFSSGDAIKLGEKLKISERTVARWLKDFQAAGLIVRSRQGHYIKTQLAELTEAA